MLPQVPSSRGRNKKSEKKLILSEKSSPEALKLTEEELDALLDPAAISQELAEMHRRGIAPSQITADVTEAVRWQDKFQETLDNMAKSNPGEQTQGWVQDLIEDFIAFEVSPSNTVDETETLLKGLKQSFIDLENSGYGAEARNFIATLKAELDIILEKLHDDHKV
jgi:hypothetical protein